MRSDLLPVLRQSILAAKPRVPKPLAAPLKLEHGWLLPCLLAIEGELWGRWEHWHDTMMAGRVIRLHSVNQLGIPLHRPPDG